MALPTTRVMSTGPRGGRKILSRVECRSQSAVTLLVRWAEAGPRHGRRESPQGQHLNKIFANTDRHLQGQQAICIIQIRMPGAWASEPGALFLSTAVSTPPPLLTSSDFCLP